MSTETIIEGVPCGPGPQLRPLSDTLSAFKVMRTAFFTASGPLILPPGAITAEESPMGDGVTEV